MVSIERGDQIQLFTKVPGSMSLFVDRFYHEIHFRPVDYNFSLSRASGSRRNNVSINECVYEVLWNAFF